MSCGHRRTLRGSEWNRALASQNRRLESESNSRSRAAHSVIEVYSPRLTRGAWNLGIACHGNEFE